MIQRYRPKVKDREWLVILGAFLGLEAVALMTPGNSRTASEAIRQVAGISPRRPWRPVGMAAVIGFSTWLAVHIIRDPETYEECHV
jgi:hypothetical protein